MSNHPATSMIKTLLGNSPGGYSFTRDKEGKILKMDIWMEDLIKLNEVGYMYIVDSDDSEGIADGDHVAYKPVKPVAIVRFTRQGFKFPIEERKDSGKTL